MYVYIAYDSDSSVRERGKMAVVNSYFMGGL